MADRSIMLDMFLSNKEAMQSILSLSEDDIKDVNFTESSGITVIEVLKTLIFHYCEQASYGVVKKRANDKFYELYMQEVKEVQE
ncbi:MAG TPA: hypothetical protein VKY45_07595 [Marinilabiliaceae bacterium]|nr:hypothetical protein [Marinilabiliaceae bacterium]